jgi:hypothetical protein
MFQNVLIIVFVGILAWFLVRLLPGRGSSGKRANKDATAARPFSAVSVFPAPTACEAARAIKGNRFLSVEAPLLPLPQCTAERCHCIYHHHADRRTGNGDRRALGSAGALLLGNTSKNRRSSAGRRGIDKDGDLSWT